MDRTRTLLRAELSADLKKVKFFLPDANSGSVELAPVGGTATPDNSFSGGISGWRRGGRARLVGERHH